MERPNSIQTSLRIFRITDHDGETFLCNLHHLILKDLDQIRILHHYWNDKFERFGKDNLKEMLLNY